MKTPDPLDLVESFLNTLHTTQPDEFETEEALATWCAERGVNVHPVPGDAARARRFRESLRVALEAYSKEEAGVDAWLEVERGASALRFAFRAQPLRFDSCDSGADRLIGEILSRVQRAGALGVLKRMKVCADDTCRWAFFDESKNSSGRWCNMAVCGNRNKARRRRQKSVERKFERTA